MPGTKASLSGKELILRIFKHLGCAIKELDKIRFLDLISLSLLTFIYHKSSIRLIDFISVLNKKFIFLGIID